MNIIAFPNLDSLNIGDTIWLEINASTNFQDLQTGSTIDYSHAVNLGSALSFVELVGGTFSDPGAIPAANRFNYKLIYGTSVDNPRKEQIREYLFFEEQNKYKFKLAVIPQSKGIFAMGIGNAASVYRMNDKCTKAAFAIAFINTSQHLYLLEQSRPGYTPSGQELTNLYCFKVK